MQTRLATRAMLRDAADRDDIDRLYEHAGVLLHLAAAGLVVSVIAIIDRAIN